MQYTIDPVVFDGEDPATYPQRDQFCGVIVQDDWGGIHHGAGLFCPYKKDWQVFSEYAYVGGVFGDSVYVEEWVLKSVGKPIKKVWWFLFPDVIN